MRASRSPVLNRVSTGWISVIIDDDFGARLQIERGQHGIHARRRVGNESQIFRARADEGAEHGSRFIEHPLQFAQEEVHGVPLEPLANLSLLGLNDERARAECAVVQVDHVGVEAEVLCKRATGGAGHGYIPGLNKSDRSLEVATRGNGGKPKIRSTVLSCELCE